MSGASPVGAVVIGGYITALSTARAVAARRVPVAVVVTNRDDIAHHSRHVRDHAALYEFATAPESLVDLLERRAERWPGWVVLPASDAALAVVATHRERLRRSYRVAAPPWEVARSVLHKDLTYVAFGRSIPTSRAAGGRAFRAGSVRRIGPMHAGPPAPHTLPGCPLRPRDDRL